MHAATKWSIADPKLNRFVCQMISSKATRCIADLATISATAMNYAKTDSASSTHVRKTHASTKMLVSISTTIAVRNA